MCVCVCVCVRACVQSTIFSAVYNMEQVLGFFLSGGGRVNHHLLKGYLAQLRVRPQPPWHMRTAVFVPRPRVSQFFGLRENPGTRALAPPSETPLSPLQCAV
jgi:hypothetical protein